MVEDTHQQVAFNTFEVLDEECTPLRAYINDAGADITIRYDTTLAPGETAYIPAGVKLSLIPGYHAHIMTRSSTFKKYKGLIVVPTVIDCGYTGEISTVVTNISDRVIEIPRGARLAQMVLLRHYLFANESFDTQGIRAENRFGSSS